MAGHVVERTVRETQNIHECVETLVDLTLEAGAPDNVTVVMVEIVEETVDDVKTAAVDIVPPAELAAPEGTTTAATAVTATVAPDDQTEPATASAPEAATVAPKADDAGADSHAGDGNGTAPDSGQAESKEPTATTDPHLGEHLSAEVLRQELSSRPHLLVGAAVTAAETGSIPTIAGRTVARRAATVLTHKAEPSRDEDEDAARNVQTAPLGHMVHRGCGYSWSSWWVSGSATPGRRPGTTLASSTARGDLSMGFRSGWDPSSCPPSRP